MTAAREELAALIGRCVDRNLPGLPMGPVQEFMAATADAILAAGWRPPAPTTLGLRPRDRSGRLGDTTESASPARTSGGEQDAEDDMS